MKKDPNKYPKGWNAAKIRKVIEYYDNQSDEEGAKEIEAAGEAERVTLVEVPTVLLPQVRKLIAKHRKSA